MAKYKPYDCAQRVLMPFSLEDQLIRSSPEFAIHTRVERRMDMSVFDENYQNDDTAAVRIIRRFFLKVALM